MKPDTFSKFAIFTAIGEGLPLAYHLKLEGMEVLVGMVSDLQDAMAKEPERPDQKKIRWSAYDGMMEKEDAWKLLKRMDKFEDKDEWCVIFDFNNQWKFAAEALKMGFRYGLFPTRLDYTMEADRDLAKRFVEKNYPDLKVGEVHEFKTAEEGIEFMADSDEFWALKGNNTDAKTVVPGTLVQEHATSEIEDALNANKDLYESKGFILEKQIRDGIEVCPQMIWMDGVRVASCIDLEDKKFSPNAGSEMHGCSINIIMETPVDCELNRWAFPPAADLLAKKHKGLFYLDANIIIKDGEPYYLEFCSNRMGFDAAYAECEMSGGVASYFNALLGGETPYVERYGVGVRGFATKRESDGPLKAGLRMQFDDDEHLWLFAARKEGNKILNTGFEDGYSDLAAFTEASDDPHYALEKLQEVINNFSFPGLYTRQDVSTLLARLEGLGKYLLPANE